MSNSFPCKCGHIKIDHYFGMGYSTCLQKYKEGIWCRCSNFISDNLRYLEQKALDK